MNQFSRLIAFLGLTAGLIAIFLIHNGEVATGGSAPNTIIFTALLMLAFVTLLLEHWFTKPTDTIASSIAVLLTILPSREALSAMRPMLDVLAAYCLFVLVLATSAIVFSPQERGDCWRTQLSDYLRRASAQLGSSRVLFGLLFFFSLISYSLEKQDAFIQLMAFAGLVILIDPKSLPSLVFRRKSAPFIGEIIGVQSKNTIIARLAAKRETVRRYDFVEFADPSEEMISRKGIIIDNWVLNSQQWIKIYSSQTVAKFIGSDAVVSRKRRGLIYKISPANAEQFTSKFVGTISEGTKIESINFYYAMQTEISEGTLLQVNFSKRNVLYQVTQGATVIEKLELRNEAGLIIGSASQVGEWKPEIRTFDKYGWLPEINKPVMLADNIVPVAPEVGEYVAGTIPGTNFPIFLNKSEAISHHIAILGVTGTGKSVFARDLMRRTAADGTKIIIVDFTEEHRKALDPALVHTFLLPGIEAQIYTQVDILANQMGQFPNNRNHQVIAHAEGQLRQLFGQSLLDFVQSDQNIAILELPDVSNSNAILSFTRWAIKTLFEKARAGDFNGQRFCIVLEEAHTVVPEWNFVSSEDKSAKALINQIGQIALQGRKYGVGFIVIAQRTANVSKTVLTQCNSLVAFKQFDKTGTEFISNYTGDAMASAVANLVPRRAVVVGRAFSSNGPVIIQVPEILE